MSLLTKRRQNSCCQFLSNRTKFEDFRDVVQRLPEDIARKELKSEQKCLRKGHSRLATRLLCYLRQESLNEPEEDERETQKLPMISNAISVTGSNSDPECVWSDPADSNNDTGPAISDAGGSDLFILSTNPSSTLPSDDTKGQSLENTSTVSTGYTASTASELSDCLGTPALSEHQNPQSEDLVQPRLPTYSPPLLELCRARLLFMIDGVETHFDVWLIPRAKAPMTFMEEYFFLHELAEVFKKPVPTRIFLRGNETTISMSIAEIFHECRTQLTEFLDSTYGLDQFPNKPVTIIPKFRDGGLFYV